MRAQFRGWLWISQLANLYIIGTLFTDQRLFSLCYCSAIVSQVYGVLSLILPFLASVVPDCRRQGLRSRIVKAYASEPLNELDC